MTKEEVPDRFTDLLAKLRAAESSDTPAGKRGDNAQS
ncbi:MAG: NepR family anti-sigma factor [Sagittula sp.]